MLRAGRQTGAGDSPPLYPPVDGGRELLRAGRQTGAGDSPPLYPPVDGGRGIAAGWPVDGGTRQPPLYPPVDGGRRQTPLYPPESRTSFALVNIIPDAIRQYCDNSPRYGFLDDPLALLMHILG